MEENKKNVRKGILIGCIASAALLLGFLGSYAYFIGTSNNNQRESAKVQTGNLALTFSDGSSSFQGSLEFGKSATKSFTIENTGSLEANAKINWLNLVNTYLEESLTYSLSYSETENGTYTEIISNGNVPKSENPIKRTLASDLVIPVGKTYYYKLIITLNYLEDTDQTADLNAMLRAEFSLEEDNDKPLLNSLFLKTNDSSITDYNSGVKTEMYTFSHPEATQTTGWSEEERTDYRYIGNVPKNYIEFNDEIWRIIGVFTVENENGEKEKRIKIIKNDSIGKIPWNSNGTNEWAISSLSITMNSGDYFNRTGSYINNGLTLKAKSQISPVKWYLGGTNTLSTNGATFYSYERGIETCTTNGFENCASSPRDVYSIQNLGLIYPSDYIYTFANNVDNTCFTRFDLCDDQHGGNPSLSWLFFSYYWTIMPSSDHFNCVITVSDYNAISKGGVIYGKGWGELPDVYPVLYLKSNIEFSEGDGSVDNPYILS